MAFNPAVHPARPTRQSPHRAHPTFRPPVGYRHGNAANRIDKDAALFPRVRKMWDLLLTGTPISTIREVSKL